MCESPHSSPYCYPNPVPKRWAVIAGTFLKLICDPCKQPERVHFPNVGLPPPLLFPLFSYLQWNCNTKNSLSRGDTHDAFSTHQPAILCGHGQKPRTRAFLYSVIWLLNLCDCLIELRFQIK